MAKKRYPKSEVDRLNSIEGPAYYSWADKKNESEAFSQYAKALEEGESGVIRANTRDFRNLDTGIDGRPGLRNSDFDWFRPGQAAPVKSKDNIAFARFAYRRVGLLRNAIDLMGDFASQGIRLSHPNKTIERFYNDWFKEVRGPFVTERMSNLLCREANVVARWYTAKLNIKQRLEMQKSIAAEDISIKKNKSPYYSKREIPWRYNFIDPIVVEPLGGVLSTLAKQPSLLLNIPSKVRSEIAALSNSNSEEAREVLKNISPDILRAISENKQKVMIPQDKCRVLYYKKDDWQVWADPMLHSAFEDINLYQTLKLTDKAALDGARNKIRVWKIGSLEHKLAPSPKASSILAGMLGANVGGGTIDVVWGPDIELIETSSDIQSYLGEEKYKPTLMAIYAALGIPPTLTGTFGASGTTNNFISLKTLIERLQYIRRLVSEFWEEQIKIVQKAMGFAKPASVEFSIMHLEDPASIMNILISMADRNIISDEFVQRYSGANPDVEYNRILKESKTRERKDMEKVSPYHQVDKDFGLSKIALQTGQASPSEVGLNLEERKEGEKTLMDMKMQESRNKRGNIQDKSSPGEPGRPKNSNDLVKRKEKTFKPKTKAEIEIWAKRTQDKISKVINPKIVAAYGKSSIRELNSDQINALESLKFEILCNLNVGEDINEQSIASAYRNPNKDIHTEFKNWISAAEEKHGKLTIEEIRSMRAYFYVCYMESNK